MTDLNPFMEQALTLAHNAKNNCTPNPAVGAVLVSSAGNVIGVGHTQPVGGPHAEVMALKDASSRGHVVRDSTLYVTLEPCSHHGRTGPCCDAIIAAGIAKVVASIVDPNPMVASRGFDRLRASGIDVEIGPGAEKSRELNIGFFSRMVRKRPWIRMKVAASIDGKTGLNNGYSQWITSDLARTDGHAWRARSCAILTGIGTVLQDDPSLDVRYITAQRQPNLILLDSMLRIPLDAKILRITRSVYIYTTVENSAKKIALESLGVTVIYMPNLNGKVDLENMLKDLADREINELHVEAGQHLNGALLQEDLVDELVIYLAPKIIGIGQNIAKFGPLDNLADSVFLEFKSIEKSGPDVRLLASVSGHANF